jgi:hypothetical protein
MATMETGENYMARNGKIARLPRDIRSQLNTRLQDGAQGKQLVRWLNSLPEVKKVLAQFFHSRPINDQNLTEWRQGGYEDWLAHQDILAQSLELAANQEDLQTAAPGQSLTDHLTNALAFRYGAILAVPGPRLDEPALRHLRSLGRTCQAVVKLRRSEQNAARLKIETECWQLNREKIQTGLSEALDHKLREKLAAPVWAALKTGERVKQFGATPAVRFGIEYLREIESCDDPAHFQSKVMASKSPEEWERYFEEQAKNPPKKPDAMQAAMDTLDRMDAYLDRKEAKRKDPDFQPPAERPRRSRKPTKRPSARPVHPVHKVHPASPPKPSEAGSIHPAPPPPQQTNPQSAIRNPQSNLSRHPVPPPIPEGPSNLIRVFFPQPTLTPKSNLPRLLPLQTAN